MGILETIDTILFESKKRKQEYETKDLRKRSAMTDYGNIEYLRRYYRNKKTKEYVYLADEKMGIEKNERIMKDVESKIIEFAHDVSYSKTGKQVLPSLGSEESYMYCVCRDRMKKNRTSWSVIGAEAMLKVIMNKMNGTIEEVIRKKAEKKIKEELAQRIPEPKSVKKVKENKIVYAEKYEIANNFTGGTKEFIIDLLKDKKCSELMLIN